MRTIVRIAHGLRIHNAAGAAPAMAFNFFLSLVPLLVLIGFVLGQVVRKRGVEALLGPVLDAGPDAAESVIRRELERMSGTTSTPMAPLGIAGFLWLASSGTHGLMDTFEVAVGAPRRSWWKQRAIALAWVVGGVGALAAFSWGVIEIDSVVARGRQAVVARVTPTASASAPPSSASASSSATQPTRGSHGRYVEHDVHPVVPTKASRFAKKIVPAILEAPWERALALAALAALGLTGLAGFYRSAVFHPPGVQRRAWPGALVALATWLVASWGFGIYAGSLASYTLFYGSLAAVAVLLMWCYLTSWSLLLGAEVNAQLEGIRDVRSP